MKKNSFTLLELSVVMLIIVSLASFMVSQGLPIVEQTIDRQYKKSVESTAKAIVGDNSIRDFDGSVVPFGYLNDMGSFPEDIEDLWEKPISVPEYTKHTFTVNGVSDHLFGGWNGPYFGSSNEKLNEKLRDNLRLERGDFDFADETVDSTIDSDDVKLHAVGYSDTTETFIYGEKNFSERTVTVIGDDKDYDLKLTIKYLDDGNLQTHEEFFKYSTDTTIELPKTVCAFYAQLVVDHVVIDKTGTPPISPEVGHKYLVEEPTSGAFTGQENNVLEWNGSLYTPVTVEDEEKLQVLNDNTYFIYDSTETETGPWVPIKGHTPNVIKTIKTDILLELE